MRLPWQKQETDPAIEWQREKRRCHGFMNIFRYLMKSDTHIAVLYCMPSEEELSDLELFKKNNNDREALITQALLEWAVFVGEEIDVEQGYEVAKAEYMRRHPATGKADNP